VIGILQPKGRLLTEGTGLSTLDFDNSVIMPYTSFPFGRMLGSRRLLDGLVVRLNDDSEARILSAASQVDELLRSRHRGVRDYRLVVPVSLLREARETQALFALIMGSIAGLSLLVGGIGVMNIMLANVAEQTREIGLRMAVGATKGRIVGLYLCHSMLLCLVGGVLGLSGGILTALGVEYYAQWAVAFSGFGLILGPLSALVTGLIFGLYPAFRAATLNPALALREA
jgi:putative ABC transport system permease protein